MRAVLKVATAILILGTTFAPLQARAVDISPVVYSGMSVQVTDGDLHDIFIHGYRNPPPYVAGVACAGASRVTVDGDRKTVLSEGGCYTARSYHLDPIAWVGSIEGTTPTSVYRITYERTADGSWRQISFESLPESTVDVDITFTGTGETTTKYYTDAVYICYVGPPFGPVCPGYAGIAQSRSAAAMGTVRFNALDATVTLSGSEAAVMGWSSPFVP